MKTSRFNKRLLGYYIFIVVCTVQIALGVLWFVLNIREIPQYGDTTGYITMAKTLLLPTGGYRVIGYPLVIRILSMFSESHFHIIVYLFQIIVFCSAILYFLQTLISFLDHCKIRKIQNRIRVSWYFIFLLVILTNPLLLHFHLSLMPDSLAMSCALLFLTALFALFYGPGSPIVPGILFAISFFCLSLLRPEKLSFCVAVVIINLIISLWHHRRSLQILQISKQIIWLLVVVGLLITGLKEVNRRTQTQEIYYLPPITFSIAFLSHAAWPHLSQVYPKLPDDIQTMISYEDAVHFDTKARLREWFIWQKIAVNFTLTEQSFNNLKKQGMLDETVKNLLAIKNQQITGENLFLDIVEQQIGQESTAKYKTLLVRYAEKTPVENFHEAFSILNTIIKISCQEYWDEILLRAVNRFTEYLFSPFVFFYETRRLPIPFSGATRWTVTRMEMYSKPLTNVFLKASHILLIVQTLFMLLFHPAMIKRLAFPFITLFIGSIINSASFSLVQPQGWHVRYSLISFVTILLFLLCANLLGFLAEDGTD